MRWPDRPLARQRQRRHSGSANLLLPTARRAGQDLAFGFAEAHDEAVVAVPNTVAAVVVWIAVWRR
ncbi:hypothetical protein [Nocardia sp. NBC_01009]|uniref:hypothetical protein n=1 Tax=Nocardia sp. NBC_01009 TaxID=2975996 RepID=UPI003864D4ED|nr:hypothetical protein OHA42_28095 [Nocardia sp. NBC_01009]